MAMFLFADAIIKVNPIKVFNNGEHEQDFTYKEDVVKVINMEKNIRYIKLEITNL